MIFTLGTSLAYAQNANLTETDYDQILLEAGMPEALLASMDIYDKQFILENSSGVSSKGYNFRFDGYSESRFAYNENGELVEVESISPSSNSTFANIPNDDLILTMYHFETYYNGKLLHDIYAQFEWLDYPHQSSSISYYGIQNDYIGIAIPADWEIQANMYACATQYKNHTNGNSWSSPVSDNCNDGDPVEFDLYGVAWKFKGNLVDMPLTKYKGSVKLSMEKKVSTATERAIVKYSQSKPVGGIFTLSIGFGPVSIDFTPFIGTNDTASKDISW